MIHAEDFVDAARQRGFQLYAGVPCSYLKPFINYVIDSPGLRYVGAANEGDAVAIAAGAELGGVRAAVMFQNSGFGNAINPLTSLNAILRLPVLAITTWRGEPGGDADEPQHERMGQITPGLFDLMGLPWSAFPDSREAVGPALDEALRQMTERRLPYGFIMKKGTVAAHALRTSPQPRPLSSLAPPPRWPDRATWPARSEALAALRDATSPSDALIATTGFIGRGLYALGDEASQLYMVGSMGCAASLGLGLALVRPKRRVVVIDGDGALLMRLGSLATVGYERPTNLLHVVLDNEAHESTGGQSTVTHSVDLAAVAAACGYPEVERAGSAADLANAVRDTRPGLRLIHAKIRPEPGDALPRPSVTPAQVAARFQAWLRETEAS